MSTNEFCRFESEKIIQHLHILGCWIQSQEFIPESLPSQNRNSLVWQWRYVTFKMRGFWWLIKVVERSVFSFNCKEPVCFTVQVAVSEKCNAVVKVENILFSTGWNPILCSWTAMNDELLFCSWEYDVCHCFLRQQSPVEIWCLNFETSNLHFKSNIRVQV